MTIGMKFCNDCKDELPFDSFKSYPSRLKDGGDGLSVNCKRCIAKNRKPMVQVAPPEEKVCRRCNKMRPITMYEVAKSKDGHAFVCNTCKAEAVVRQKNPRPSVMMGAIIKKSGRMQSTSKYMKEAARIDSRSQRKQSDG